MSDHRDDTVFPQGLDLATKQFIITAVREAIDQDNDENDSEYADFAQDQMALALQKYHDQYFRSTRQLIKEAVNEAIAGGQLKFDEKQLRGQVHQVLNTRLEPAMREILRKHDLGMNASRSIELTRIINAAFNRKLAEAGYLVAQEFMSSDNVRNRLVGSTNESLETFFEDPDTKDLLGTLMTEAVEAALADQTVNVPINLVQHISEPIKALSASEILAQTKGLLSSNDIRNAQTEAEKEPPKRIIDEARELMNVIAHDKESFRKIMAELNAEYEDLLEELGLEVLQRRESPRFDTLSHQQLGPWAIANDIVQEYHFDTNLTRRLLQLRLNQGRLIWPGEDEPRG